MQSAKDGLEWRTTLVLMGLPPREVPFPPNFSPDQIAKQTERIRKAAAEYDPDERP